MLRADALVARAGQAPINFDAAPGTCTGLLGDAGASILDVCAGTASAHRGRVVIDEGASMAWMTRATSALDRRITAAEYVEAVAASWRHRGVPLRTTPSAALERLRIAPRATADGVRMRTAIALAAALVPAAGILLLDEPFAGLDDAQRQAAIGWIQALAADPVAIIGTFAAERDARAVSHRVLRVEPVS